MYINMYMYVYVYVYVWSCLISETWLELAQKTCVCLYIYMYIDRWTDR